MIGAAVNVCFCGRFYCSTFGSAWRSSELRKTVDVTRPCWCQWRWWSDWTYCIASCCTNRQSRHCWISAAWGNVHWMNHQYSIALLNWACHSCVHTVGLSLEQPPDSDVSRNWSIVVPMTFHSATSLSWYDISFNFFVDHNWGCVCQMFTARIVHRAPCELFSSTIDA